MANESFLLLLKMAGNWQVKQNPLQSNLDYPDFFSGPVFFMNINKLWSQKLSEVKKMFKIKKSVFKTAHLPLRFQKI